MPNCNTVLEGIVAVIHPVCYSDIDQLCFSENVYSSNIIDCLFDNMERLKSSCSEKVNIYKFVFSLFLNEILCCRYHYLSSLVFAILSSLRIVCHVTLKVSSRLYIAFINKDRLKATPLVPIVL